MKMGEMPTGAQPEVKKPEDQFRKEASTAHAETIEKMDEIVFEKEVQELEQFGEQVEKDIVELEQEIEEFCAEEASECERTPQPTV